MLSEMCWEPQRVAPSCYLSVVSPDWSLKPQQVRPASSAPCSGRAWAAPAPAQPCSLCGWHATDTRWQPGSQPPHGETQHFILSCENVLEKDSHPAVGAVAQAPSVTALSLPSARLNSWCFSSTKRIYTLSYLLCFFSLPIFRHYLCSLVFLLVFHSFKVSHTLCYARSFVSAFLLLHKREAIFPTLTLMQPQLVNISC